MRWRHQTTVALLALLFLGGLVVAGPGTPVAHGSDSQDCDHPAANPGDACDSASESSHDLGDSEIKLEGFVDVAPPGPGGSLNLPVAAPVVVSLSFGIPAVSVPIRITPTTAIESEKGPLATLADGDRVKVKVRVVAGALEAVKLELEEFPELKLVGTAQGLPPLGLSLPLPPATTADFVLGLGASGVTLPIRLTSATKLEEGPFVLHNGDSVKIEALMQDFHIVATEIEPH